MPREEMREAWDRLSEYQRRVVRDCLVRWKECRRMLAVARDDLGDLATGATRSELAPVKAEIDTVWDDLDAAVDLLDKHERSLERLSAEGK